MYIVKYCTTNVGLDTGQSWCVYVIYVVVGELLSAPQLSLLQLSCNLLPSLNTAWPST